MGSYYVDLHDAACAFFEGYVAAFAACGYVSHHRRVLVLDVGVAFALGGVRSIYCDVLKLATVVLDQVVLVFSQRLVAKFFLADVLQVERHIVELVQCVVIRTSNCISCLLEQAARE